MAPTGDGDASRLLSRRCEQLHTFVEVPPEQRWQIELPRPRPASKAVLTSGQVPDGGPVIGDVAQWVAPEWFWQHPGWGTTEREGLMGEGELSVDAARAGDIFVGTRDGVPLEPKFIHMRARDFVATLVPGYLTRQLGYAAPRVGDAPDAPMEATSPGPLFEFDIGEPILLRVTNEIRADLHLEVSVHYHGGHTPAS